MGWQLSNGRLRYELVSRESAEDHQGIVSALSFRKEQHDPEIQHVAIDLSAAVRRLGGALGNPTLATLAQLIVRQLPPLDRGSNGQSQMIVLGVDWIERHTPRRAAVNTTRQSGARPAEPTLGPVIRRHDTLDFNAIVAWPKSKRRFFSAFCLELQHWIGSLAEKNLEVHLLGSEGVLRVFRFDEHGVMKVDVKERFDDYGEADLAIPFYIRTAFPETLQWEYHTCDWDSLFCVSLFGFSNVSLRLNKVSREEICDDPKKRKAPDKQYEVISGRLLCSIWDTPAMVFACMASGTTDYARGLSGYGITKIVSAVPDLTQAIYYDADRRICIHPERLMLALSNHRRGKGRAVYIGDDNVIHLTSRTAPSDAIKTDRTGDMFHDDLIALLWSLAYYGGASRESKLPGEWAGPDEDLNSLSLFASGLTLEQALVGATSPSYEIVLG